MSQTLEHEQSEEQQPEAETSTRSAGLLSRLRDRRSYARVGFIAPVAGLLVAGAVITTLVSQHRAEEARLAVLEDAKEACAPGFAVPGVNLEDEGRTLIVDTEGDDDASGATYSQLACVLDETGAPGSVTARMESTRALDGRQDGSWGDIEASWSYHPDSGMDLILSVS